MQVYAKMNVSFMEGSMETEAFDIELQKLCGKYNVSMLVLDGGFPDVISNHA